VAIAQAPVRSRRMGSEALGRLLVASGALTVGFWIWSPWTNPAALYFLYVWTGLVGSLAVLQFWMVLGERYTVSQAKRLYGLMGTGSLAGAAAGAALARLLAGVWPASILVLAAGTVLVLTGLGPARWLRWTGSAASSPRPTPVEAPMGEAARLLQRHPYVRGLAALVLVSTAAMTLGDYVFKSAVARHVPAQELGEFFANVNVVLGLLALVAQALLSNWLLRRFGLHRALWVFPVLLALGAAGVALGGGFGAALWLKGADGTLRNSLHRTGNELLFVPLSDALRARAKPFIDLVGQRGGQALASFLILSEAVLHRGDVVLAGACAALCLVWIAWSADLRGHYVELFRAALREGSLRPSADLPSLDLGSLEALFAALSSSDDGEVLAAMDLLDQEGRGRLIPALILHHPSPAVVLRALELFLRAGRVDFVPLLGRLLGHPDPEVRAAALRAHTRAHADDGTAMRAGADDPSPLVRATAVVGLLAGGAAAPESETQSEAALDVLSRSSLPEARAALAHAIREQPAPRFAELLLRLADDPAETVQAATALAMAALPDARFLPSLLPMLASRDVRPAARQALRAHGHDALAFLDASLGDRALPHELRRHLPSAVSVFPAQPAVDVLQRHLLDEADGLVRYKILRALNRLSLDPEVTFDRALFERAVAATIEAAVRLVHWRRLLEAGAVADPARRTAGHELLVRLLRDKQGQAVERLFRMMSILDRREDFRSMYHGLHSSDRRTRASSRELLENLLRTPIRQPLMALVGDGPEDERMARIAAYYPPPALSYVELVARLLEEPGESLKILAAYHVGELGLRELRPRLEQFRPHETGFFLARVVERALRLLAAPPRPGLAGV
jgi:HEAT repeat protein